MKLIATTTVGSGGAANIEFTSIPQTYTNLVVFVSARSSTTVNFYRINLNSSASNFSGRYLGADGTSVVSGLSSPAFGRMSQSNYTASTFGNDFWYIPNYTSSANKTISVDAVNENNSGSVFFLDIVAGLWSDSAAITAVKFVPNSGDFAQHTTASLYGITKGSDGIVTTS
jgi:hypothetical protein